jgi:hypothetical protein
MDETELGGQRIGAGMRRAKHAVLDRQAGVGRAELHRATCGDILAAAEHHRKVGIEQGEGLTREEVRDGIALGGDEGLDRMADGVEAGAGGDLARLGEGERGIEQCDARHRLAVAARHLLVRLLIGDQRVALALAAGAGGGRNGDEWQERFGRRVGVPVVAHPSAIGQQEVAALGGVHRAAAAEADDDVDFPVTRHREAGIDVGGGGVLVRPVVGHYREAGPLERLPHLGRMAGGDQALIGDQQRARRPDLTCQLAQTCQATRPRDQPRTCSEVDAGGSTGRGLHAERPCARCEARGARCRFALHAILIHQWHRGGKASPRSAALRTSHSALRTVSETLISSCRLYGSAPIQEFEEVALVRLIPVHVRGRHRPQVQAMDE